MRLWTSKYPKSFGIRIEPALLRFPQEEEVGIAAHAPNRECQGFYEGVLVLGLASPILRLRPASV